MVGAARAEPHHQTLVGRAKAGLRAVAKTTSAFDGLRRVCGDRQSDVHPPHEGRAGRCRKKEARQKGFTCQRATLFMSPGSHPRRRRLRGPARQDPPLLLRRRTSARLQGNVAGLTSAPPSAARSCRTRPAIAPPARYVRPASWPVIVRRCRGWRAAAFSEQGRVWGRWRGRSMKKLEIGLQPAPRLAGRRSITISKAPAFADKSAA